MLNGISFVNNYQVIVNIFPTVFLYCSFKFDIGKAFFVVRIFTFVIFLLYCNVVKHFTFCSSSWWIHYNVFLSLIFHLYTLWNDKAFEWKIIETLSKRIEGVVEQWWCLVKYNRKFVSYSMKTWDILSQSALPKIMFMNV